MTADAIPYGFVLLPVGAEIITERLVREDDIRAIDMIGAGPRCFVWLATEPTWHPVALPATEVARRMRAAVA
jgi:hypothetical protein